MPGMTGRGGTWNCIPSPAGGGSRGSSGFHTKSPVVIGTSLQRRLEFPCRMTWLPPPLAVGEQSCSVVGAPRWIQSSMVWMMSAGSGLPPCGIASPGPSPRSLWIR